MSTGVDKFSVILHIGENETVLTKKADGEKTFTVAIGNTSTSAAYFSHIPPTDAEIEMAINDVEDKLMPLTAEFKTGSHQLISSDPIVREIGAHANMESGELSIREMENVFSRFAAIVSGRPASMDTLPLSSEFAAGLLILREVMHHLDFKSIIIK